MVVSLAVLVLVVLVVTTGIRTVEVLLAELRIVEVDVEMALVPVVVLVSTGTLTVEVEVEVEAIETLAVEAFRSRLVVVVTDVLLDFGVFSVVVLGTDSTLLLAVDTRSRVEVPTNSPDGLSVMGTCHDGSSSEIACGDGNRKSLGRRVSSCELPFVISLCNRSKK